MAGEVSNQVKQLLKNDDSAVKLCVQGLYFPLFLLLLLVIYIPAFNDHHYVYLVHLPDSFSPRDKKMPSKDCVIVQIGILDGCKFAHNFGFKYKRFFPKDKVFQQ